MPRKPESDDPRRRELIRALSLGLLTSAFGVASRAQSLPAAKPNRLAAGRSVYRIDGEATVNGLTATPETRIGPGDTVKTAPGSEIIFAVGGHALLVRGASHVSLQADAAGESGVLRGLRVLTGALLSVSRDSRMQVRTRSAFVGIRGTGFYLEAEPDRTYFCTCYGVTEVAAASDPASRETITATHHDRPVYVLADARDGDGIRPAPFINHTDQELALIESIVGRTPPFVFPKDSYGGPRRRY